MSAASNDGQSLSPAFQDETEAGTSKGQSGTPLIGYKRRLTKQIVIRGQRPSDIDSNEETSAADLGEREPPGEDEPPPKRPKTSGNETRRNRASPARLFKLNQGLVQNQKDRITDIEFGGMLSIATKSMPGDFSQWVMKQYDPEMSQLVIPERGKIPVDSASVRRIWGLPNKGMKVCYEKRQDMIEEMNNIFKITSKGSPSLTSWCTMIKNLSGASDDNFLRAWLALVFSCFLAPTTSLNISLRSYPAAMYVNAITNGNICQFVVDQLKLAFAGAGDKNVVCCCVFHLVLLYLDSLDVDEPMPCTLPRVSIWNSDLIAKVVKKDKKGPGEYGKLRLKNEFSRCADDSLFGSMDHVTKFVAARLPESYDKRKQEKLTALVHGMCSEISHAVGKLVKGFGTLDDEEATTSTPTAGTTGTSNQHSRKRSEPVQSDSDTLPSDEESWKSDSENNGEDDNDSVGSDEDEGSTDGDDDDGDAIRAGDGPQDQGREHEQAAEEEAKKYGEDEVDEQSGEGEENEEDNEHNEDEQEGGEDKDRDSDDDTGGDDGKGDGVDDNMVRGGNTSTDNDPENSGNCNTPCN